MHDLIAKKIFSEYVRRVHLLESVLLFPCRVKMVDFQGVCLQRTLRHEKSAGGLFRGVRSRASSTLGLVEIDRCF